MSPMSPRLLRPRAGGFFLDQHLGARLAFSLRRLSSRYAGPVVTVRRSSDNAEADFSASGVADGKLAAWVGAGNNGFVRTWYDQSGNGSHAQQATAAAQPKVVDTGSLCVDSKGFPTILCDNNATYGMRVDGAGMFAGDVFLAMVVTPTNNDVAGGGRFFANVSGTSGLTDFRLDFANSRVLFYTGASFVNGTFGALAQGANPIGLFGARILNGPSGIGQVRRNGADFGTNANIGNHTSGAAQTAISLFSSGPATGGRYVGTMTEFLLWPDSRPNTFQQIDDQLMRHYKLP